MSNHVVFNGVDDAAKARLEAYWANKLPRLRKLLAHYRPDLLEIRLTVYHHRQSPPRSWYEVRGVIHLPTGTMAAEADDKDAEAAVDRVADLLAAEIKRHNELVRRDYVFKRKARERADLSAAGPMLQRHAESGGREDFFRVLRPLLRFLADHARREIHSLELEGLLHRGEVTAADVLDEVLTLAWQRFADRPRHMSLDLWLTDLLYDALERLVKQEPRPHVSLEEKPEEVPPNDVPPMEARQEEEEKEWWDELPVFERTALLEDHLPGSEEAVVEEEVEANEQRDRLPAMVGQLPVAQRQALLLHALENYDTAEIAMLQDRPESEVKADIEAARRTLRDRLPAGGNAGAGTRTTAAAATDGGGD